MKDTVSHYVPPHSPLTSTDPQVFSNNLTMPARIKKPAAPRGRALRPIFPSAGTKTEVMDNDDYA